MKRKIGILGIVLAFVFMVLGFCSTTPDKYIRSYGDNKMYEYVGGDAYNYIIEAALRGGEIAGARTTKAIYFGVAGILLIFSLSLLSSGEKAEELRGDIAGVKKEIQDAEKSISQSNESSANLQKEQLASLRRIIELQEKMMPKDDKAEEITEEAKDENDR